MKHPRLVLAMISLLVVTILGAGSHLSSAAFSATTMNYGNSLASVPRTVPAPTDGKVYKNQRDPLFCSFTFTWNPPEGASGETVYEIQYKQQGERDYLTFPNIKESAITREARTKCSAYTNDRTTVEIHARLKPGATWSAWAKMTIVN
jgi:hypothetical protein